jgi:hypothetical protein
MRACELLKCSLDDLNTYTGTLFLTGKQKRKPRRDKGKVSTTEPFKYPFAEANKVRQTKSEIETPIEDNQKSFARQPPSPQELRRRQEAEWNEIRRREGKPEAEFRLQSGPLGDAL